jgi:signal transduction histidine kinase/AraC-like DNA-binding protein
VENYRHKQNDQSSISNNHINIVYEDKSNNLWIGTAGGLNLLDRETNKFTSFRVKNGLASDIILSILEDDHGNLWMATPVGITRFYLDESGQEQVTNYPVSDPITFYAEEVSYKDDNGVMYFGGKNGFISFHPDHIQENTRIPPIVVTDFKLFNESVIPGMVGESPLQYEISETDQIILLYDQNFISFEFAALDYTDPGKNLYAYKMEGIEEEWVNSDASQRFANYTDMQPGEYVFMVKGSNNDGVWNDEGTSIRILITPPWWRTTWAYAAYIFLFTLTLYALRRYDQKRQNLKHELEMEHVHSEKLEEVDRMKSRFFTNISHEFRTPLTLIKGPVKQLVSGEFKGNLREQYRMILRNSDRLLKLVNQLLDFSKLESGQMKLKVAHTDVVKFLNGIVLSFCSLAERKKISLNYETKEESLMGYIDHDKIEKILTNLLSNAFKFTPNGGKISVEIKNDIPGKAGIQNNEWIPHQVRDDNNSQFQIPNSDLVEIVVTNTGPGIPPDELDKIFDRFYQADTTYKKDSEGTGIGLALTKELVELHHGSIEVSSDLENHPPQSPLNRGEVYLTIFSIILPIGKEHLSEEEVKTGVQSPETGKQIIPDKIPEEYARYSITDIEEKSDSSYQPSASGLQSPVSNISSPASGLRSPLVLIVEDNPDVTTYIRSFMDNDYRIITAINGELGWKRALDKIPELIISDVMMPVMDGFELCKKLKSDQRTSHIPVILLTAKADMESKIEGLEFGVDDYISKPFEALELQVRTKNLIDQRKILREKFSMMMEIKPGEVTASSMDEKFVKHLLEVFEVHISEPDFSTEEFAREVGMSRMHLNRKLQAIANQSTHEFIRTLRLKRAAQLLKKTAGSVSEIAYSLGFNSPSHFTYAFRKQFGQPPSLYLKRNN